ncbi:MAG: PDZ domain-containing protein [Verrucomicrobia bacterium]|nr:PDZ domain-containing protein [Verrucomicrobiota bacterium]
MKFSLLSLITLVSLTSLQAQGPLRPTGPRPNTAPKPIGTLVRPQIAAPMQPIINTSSLLKVNVTYQSYNLQIPWQKETSSGRRGLGVVLPNNRVLVTAQMVADATYIELELPDSGQKITAKVQAVDYEANLAVLAPNSPAKEKAFFSNLIGMEVDTSARIGDALSVWQTGRVGELIVTPMRISKVMTQGYVVENAAFLVYEATGIIRSEANSFTLPIVKGGKLAALLLRYDSKNQVATLLPAPIIDHFLKDVTDGKYDGFPSLGVEFQITLDEQFREYLGLKGDAPGVFINNVMKGGSADKAGVKKGDIMISINGSSIDSRGDYQDPQFGALSVSHIVRGRSFIGDDVEIRVIREGKEIVLKSQLTRKNVEDYLVLPYLFDKGPKYVLSGGLLFQELTRSYLNSFGNEQQGGPILRLQRIANTPDEFEKDGRKKIVFLSAILPTSSTQGYERMNGQVVEEVNGKKITEIADVAAALKEPKDGLHIVKLREFPFILHLDALKVEKDNLQLLNGMFRVSELTRLE